MTGRQESALELDRSIDRLIASPAAPRTADEGELTATARILRETLPRLHPRFSFEEHLARRLAVLGRGPAPTTEPTPIRPPEAVPTVADVSATALAEADRRRRGLVAGGAIASGVSLAIPIAGAAIVVWRRNRSSGGLL